MGVNVFVGILPLYLIAAAFVLPVFTLFIKDRRFFEGYGIVAAGIALVISAKVFMDVTREGIQKYYFGGFPPPLGIAYEVDKMGALLGFVASLIVFVTTVYSAWFMRVKGVEWYYALLLGIEAGSVGVLYTGDFFNIFVMLEVLSISAYGLVSFYRWRGKSLSASIEYAIVGSVATGLYFLAVVFLYGAFGTLNLADLTAKAMVGGGTLIRGVGGYSAMLSLLPLWR
jgi:multicomponent Na+:H+ antiporter subunit D